MSLTGSDNHHHHHHQDNDKEPNSRIMQPQTQLNIVPVPDPNNSSSSMMMMTSPKPAYRECLKNHAASMGGHVTDGCGEFMPSGPDGTLESLKCAACNCHRNFHRREHHSATATPTPLNHRAASHWGGGGGGQIVQPVKIAYGTGGSTSIGTPDSSSGDEQMMVNHLQGHQFHSSAAPPPPSSGKKRFRTKFTAEQKEKMLEFAERLGWRIPREDDVQVQRFCSEVGVKRQVFKVWMHNNKVNSTSAKKMLSGGANDHDGVNDHHHERVDGTDGNNHHQHQGF